MTSAQPAPRREFLWKLSAVLSVLPLGRLHAAGAPEPHGSLLALVGPDEPGQRTLISGRVLHPDGSLAAGIRLSVYHTDAEGYYTRPISDARRARIRGTLLTDRDGRYAFSGIKPGHYPDREQAAHIHAHVAGPGYPEHWIDSFYFEGDPYLTADDLARSRSAGAFGPVMSVREANGVVHARRDIRLDVAVAERNRLVDGWYRQ